MCDKLVANPINRNFAYHLDSTLEILKAEMNRIIFSDQPLCNRMTYAIYDDFNQRPSQSNAYAAFNFQGTLMFDFKELWSNRIKTPFSVYLEGTDHFNQRESVQLLTLTRCSEIPIQVDKNKLNTLVYSEVTKEVRIFKKFDDWMKNFVVHRECIVHKYGLILDEKESLESTKLDPTSIFFDKDLNIKIDFAKL